MTQHVSTLILGAGPTGLGAARRLFRQNAGSFLLVDEHKRPGGWAASHTTPEGFTFDYGGHVLFPHPEYRVFLDEIDVAVADWHASVPIRGIWCNDQSIPTPVQKNLHRLPFRTMMHCLWGLHTRGNLQSSDANPDLNVYLESKFGKALTSVLMAPLNRKMWATEPNQLCSSWSSHRSGSKEANIPEVKLRSVLRNWVLRRDELGWTTDTRVSYPLQGGTGALWKNIADMLLPAHLRLGVRAVSVDPLAKQVTLSDGSCVAYERLISSIPLDNLLRIMVGLPDLTGKADRFRAARVQIFGFGLQGPQPAVLHGTHALSIPDPKVPFWRVNVPSNFSPGNTPGGKDVWSILCECSLPPDSVTNFSAEDVKSALQSLGLLMAQTKVISEFQAGIAHGYPVPFVGRDELLNEIQPVLESFDIYSRGRFGGWRYEVSNQDHTYMQGVEIVDRLLHGTPEKTYRQTWS